MLPSFCVFKLAWLRNLSHQTHCQSVEQIKDEAYFFGLLLTRFMDQAINQYLEEGKDDEENESVTSVI